jgi:hypothetical protein
MDSTYDWVEPDTEWDDMDQYERIARRQYAHCIAAEKAMQWNPEAEDAEAHKVATKEQKQKLLNYLRVEAIQLEEEAIKSD